MDCASRPLAGGSLFVRTSSRTAYPAQVGQNPSVHFVRRKCMASFAVAIGFFRSYLWPRRCSLTQNRVREIRSVWSVAARTLGFVGPLLLLTVSASNAQGPDPNA